MTPPRCKICGHFIGWYDLENMESVECCKEHGFIQVCGACYELFEKYCINHDECIIQFVKDFEPTLTKLFHPRYACPRCDYISFTFTAAANHMVNKNHLYQGVGTYPIFVAPEHRPTLTPFHKQALRELAKSRDNQEKR